MHWDLRRHDWILLTLFAAHGAPLTPAQLQKSMFLVHRAVTAASGEGLYRFTSSRYGQYDVAVYRDAEALEAEGFAVVKRSAGSRPMYMATPAGLEHARSVIARVPPALRHELLTVPDWVRGLSFRDLVRAI